MHNRRKWLVACVLIISLFGSMVLTWAFSGNQLSFVVDSYVDQGKIYLIDDDSKKISILETDFKGKITGAIRFDKQKDGTFSVLDYLNVDQGQVYVYKRDREIVSNRILAENVYRCDFAQGRLELVWELPVEDTVDNPTDQTIFSVKVSQGNLSYFTVDYNTENFAAQAVLHRAGPVESPAQKIAAVNHDIGIGFTDFFYADNGAIVFTTPNGDIFQAVSRDGSQGKILKQAEPPAKDQPAKNITPPAAAEPASEPAKTAVPAAPAPETTAPAVPAGQQQFGREPAVGEPAADDAASNAVYQTVLPAPEKAPLPDKVPLPKQESLDVAAVLAQGMANEAAPAPEPLVDETGFTILEARQIYPDASGSWKTQLTNFTSDGKNAIYFMDLKRAGFYRVDLAEGTEEAVLDGWPGLTLTSGAPIHPYDLKNVRFTDATHFTATVATEQGTSVLGVFENGVGTVYPELTLPSGDSVLKGLLYFLGFLFGFLALYILREIFLLLTKGKVPIITKLIAAFIPVVVISMFALQHIMDTLFVKELVNKQYKELFLVSRQQVDAISPQLLAEIDLEYPYDNVYYYTLRDLVTSLPTYSTLFDGTGEKGQEVHNFSYNWLYKVENGKLYSLFCDQNYINVPIDYYYDRQTTALYYRAMADHRTIRGDFQDVGGNWIVLAIPLVNDQGEVFAVMETGITKASLEYAVTQNTKQIGMINLGVMLFLIVLLTGILLRSLAPLKKLKESVQAIINGRLGVQTPVRGHDEVAEIGRVFNQMSTSIEFHVNELTDLNDGYFKFVPSKMFELLRKSSVIDVKLGDQTNEDITILSFDAVKFEEMVSAMNGEEMFNLINRIFSNLVPIVNGNGGVVDKFENAGLVAFYTGGNERALVTAISVCQTMDRLNAEGGFGPGRQIEMANGLSYGSVMIGIVGHEERLAATTISEHTNLSGYLRRIAPKYGARILTTASAIARITDFDEKFNARFVGFLHVRANNTLEKLYDVFDGDQEEKKFLKKQTRELFERGVNLYCSKEFYEARLVFIEVLKQFRQDAAAKEYLYRCDRYYQMNNTDTIEIFIEAY